MAAISFRRLAAEQLPIVTPVAHDALTARLIEAAGFRSIAIGGSAMLAARFALPDLGLAALGEMVDGAREIVAATGLPCLIDMDDGYGDVRSVARTMQLYERLGVAAVVLEDQARAEKRPGAVGPAGVVPVEAIEEKLAAARDARQDPDLLVIARTDAVASEGLDGALRRCERYLRAGADGIFIPGLVEVSDLERAGAAFRGVHQMTIMNEGGRLPLLSPRELHAMGFAQVVYPSFIFLRAVLALSDAVQQLSALVAGTATAVPTLDAAKARALLQEAVRQRAWEQIGTVSGRA